MAKRRWVLGFLLTTLPFSVSVERLADVPYVFLTGYTQRELLELSRRPVDELEARTGLSEVPGGFSGELATQGRGAHAIASYLGTRRWGPNLTLVFGYMREYVPWLLWEREADPTDIAANYAGIAQALEEARAQR